MIRAVDNGDISRIAEILVFNNRINFLPIFGDESYSFGEMQVLRVARDLTEDRLRNIFVYDDGIVRGFVEIDGEELKRLYVEPLFQGRGIGAELIERLRKTSARSASMNAMASPIRASENTRTAQRNT